MADPEKGSENITNERWVRVTSEGTEISGNSIVRLGDDTQFLIIPPSTVSDPKTSLITCLYDEYDPTSKFWTTRVKTANRILFGRSDTDSPNNTAGFDLKFTQDKTVSRGHATLAPVELSPEKIAYKLYDTKSSNGTFIDSYPRAILGTVEPEKLPTNEWSTLALSEGSKQRLTFKENGTPDDPHVDLYKKGGKYYYDAKDAKGERLEVELQPEEPLNFGRSMVGTPQEISGEGILSRRQFSLFLKGDVIFIRDGSTNGTWIRKISTQNPDRRNKDSYGPIPLNV